jgi:carboxylesterase
MLMKYTIPSLFSIVVISAYLIAMQLYTPLNVANDHDVHDENQVAEAGAPPLCSKAVITPLLAAVALPAAALVAYDLSLDKLVAEYERNLPHDPSTGYMYGAEPRRIGPEDSRRAALFVHGFVGAGGNFADLPDRLAADGWLVRVMRLPGHGTTPRDLESVTEHDLIGAVRAELDALRADGRTVAVVGHSMGGTLAAIAAADGGVDCLVLGAPYFRVTRKWYYVLSPETWVDAVKPAVRWVRKSDGFVMVNRSEAKREIVSYGYIPVRAVDMLNRLGEHARSDSLLASVTCPVLMFHSTGDDAASFDASQEAFEKLGSMDKQFVRLERSNHHIFFDYERETVMDTTMRFLNERLTPDKE